MSMEPSSRLEGVTRRDVLSGSLAVAAVAEFAGQVGAYLSVEESSREPMRAFLADYVVPPAAIEQFLDPTARVWARFHPAYGYLLRNSSMRDGVALLTSDRAGCGSVAGGGCRHTPRRARGFEKRGRRP